MCRMLHFNTTTIIIIITTIIIFVRIWCKCYSPFTFLRLVSFISFISLVGLIGVVALNSIIITMIGTIILILIRTFIRLIGRIGMLWGIIVITAVNISIMIRVLIILWWGDWMNWKLCNTIYTFICNWSTKKICINGIIIIIIIITATW